VDGATGMVQKERTGVPLAVGPGGLSLGVKHHAVFSWEEAERRDEARWKEGAIGDVSPPSGGGHRVFAEGVKPQILTLGRWMGISGAAFTTARGIQTSLGLSLLCGIANVRLGYWWDAGVSLRRPWFRPRWRGDAVFFLATPIYLLYEFLAHFPGTAWRRWYLSDGGHFENMGAYELVRRQLRHIVIVDAEADPKYTFEGLAGLVRLARVDFGTEIRFLESGELDACVAVGHRRLFGTPDILRPMKGEDPKQNGTRTDHGRGPFSGAHAALAQVKYPAVEGQEATEGWLLYIKTSVTGDEPLDVRQYQAVHPSFPHESTADQFFDDEQWESYRGLGEHIGSSLFHERTPARHVDPWMRSPGPEWKPRDLLLGKAPGGL